MRWLTRLAWLVVALCLHGQTRAGEGTPAWNVTKSAHFVVQSQGASQAAVDELVRYAERDYNEVTRELGVTRFDGFWTWDRRAKVFLLPDSDGYERFLGQPTLSGGRADVVRREIVTFVGMRDFFERMLVHEVGHIVFREFVGFEKKLPLWLDEGVSTYLEKKHRHEQMQIVQALLDGPLFMDVEQLTRVKNGGVGLSALFYSEAGSLVGFLVGDYGTDKFSAFCSGLRKMPADGDWMAVLKQVYQFKDLAELNAAWVKRLRSG